jgi:hypothetical protein
MDGGMLVAADCELITSMHDATAEECAYIVKAINAYPLLVALRGCCELNLDEGVEPATIALLDRIDEVI